MQVLNFAFRIPKYSWSQLVNYLADEMDRSFFRVNIGKTPKASLTMHDYLFAFISSPSQTSCIEHKANSKNKFTLLSKKFTETNSAIILQKLEVAKSTKSIVINSTPIY